MQKKNNSVDAEELKKNKKKNKQDFVDDNAVRIFDDVLESDEEIKVSFRASKKKAVLINALKPLIMVSCFLIVCVFLYIFPIKNLSKDDVLIIIFFILGLFVLLEIYIIFSTIKYVNNNFLIVTNKHIILSYGFLSVEYKIIKKEDILEILCRFGKMQIKTKDEMVVFGNLDEIKEKILKIEEVIGFKK